MKHLSKFLVILLALLQVSCYKDDTTLDTRKLSEIEIQFSELNGSTLDVDKNQVLTIDPVITQSEAAKDLSYEWEVNYEVFSREKKLVYPSPKLGSFLIRLKVTNADGSSFKSFKLNVNAAYEEGLMVLTEDANGEGELAFMRKFTDAEIAAGRKETFVTNCFTINNPGIKIGKGPTDIAKRGQQVYISGKDARTIYLINNKTFEMEAAVTAFDIPDFKPLKINVPDNTGRSAVILCEQGKIYNLAVLEYLVSPDVKFPTNVIEKTAMGSDANDTYNYFWNNAASRIMQVSYYGATNSGNELQGKNLVQFFYVDAALQADVGFYAITNTVDNPSVYTKTVFTSNLGVVKEHTVLSGGFASSLNSSSIIEVNKTYRKLIYANGNKIYGWFYTGSAAPTSPFITLDAGVVTSMSQSPDGNTLYVGIYDAAAAGLKGSVHIYSMDTGALIAKHTAVTDKPVKLFYKKKD